jgi:hypothetical protein
MTKAIETFTGKLSALLEEGTEYSKDDILGMIARLTQQQDKPKRAKNPYQFFMGDKETRELVKQENSEASSKDILRLMAAKWKGFSDQDKEKYQQQADAEKQQMPETETKTKERTRARTPYQCYMGNKEARAAIVAANPEAANKDILTLMAGKWKELPEEEKVPYQQEADLDKQQFPTATKPKKTTAKKDKTGYELFQAECDRKQRAKAKAVAKAKELKAASSDSDSDSDTDSDEEEEPLSIQEQWGQLSPTEQQKYEEKKIPKAKTAKVLYQADEEVKAAAKEEHGADIKAVDLNKILAAQWKDLDHEAKETYNKAAQKEKDCYELHISSLGTKKPQLKRSISAS